MPDPKVKPPVRVAKQGDKFVCVDSTGKAMAEASYASKDAADRAAATINAAWGRAKRERKAKGAPEVTESEFTERLHPRNRLGQFRDVRGGLRAHFLKKGVAFPDETVGRVLDGSGAGRYFFEELKPGATRVKYGHVTHMRARGRVNIPDEGRTVDVDLVYTAPIKKPGQKMKTHTKITERKGMSSLPYAPVYAHMRQRAEAAGEVLPEHVTPPAILARRGPEPKPPPRPRSTTPLQPARTRTPTERRPSRTMVRLPRTRVPAMAGGEHPKRPRNTAKIEKMKPGKMRFGAVEVTKHDDGTHTVTARGQELGTGLSAEQAAAHVSQHFAADQKERSAPSIKFGQRGPVPGTVGAVMVSKRDRYATVADAADRAAELYRQEAADALDEEKSGWEDMALEQEARARDNRAALVRVEQEKAFGRGRADKMRARPPAKDADYDYKRGYESWKGAPIAPAMAGGVSELGPREGLEGPFRYRSGWQGYYSAKEGRYYDPGRDMFMDRGFDPDTGFSPAQQRAFNRIADKGDRMLGVPKGPPSIARAAVYHGKAMLADAKKAGDPEKAKIARRIIARGQRSLGEAVAARKAARTGTEFALAYAREQRLRSLVENQQHKVNYFFDPSEHPRDRLGQFVNVLSKLTHGAEANMPGGIVIHRKAGYYKVTGKGGSNLGRTRSATGAATAALAMYDTKHKGRVRKGAKPVLGVASYGQTVGGAGTWRRPTWAPSTA